MYMVEEKDHLNMYFKNRVYIKVISFQKKNLYDLQK